MLSNLLRKFTTHATNQSSLIKITQPAWTKMKHIQTQTQHGTFLFAAQAGGCAGLNYEFKNLPKSEIDEFVGSSKIKVTEIVNHESSSISVTIDPLSEMYLIGTTIDYISEDYQKGIFESKFIFIPDKSIAAGCGCGTSFYLKE